MDPESDTPEKLIEAKIQAYASRIEMSACNGCDECGLRCSGDIQMTESEFEGIWNFLSLQKPEEVARVLGQEKKVEFTLGWTIRYCLFRDMEKKNCFIYPARPLICRLFGYTEWLPCPIAKVPFVLKDAVQIMQDYSALERKTFREWMEKRRRARCQGS